MILEISNFRLAFTGYEGTAHVLNGVDLAIAEGEAVGVVGETGCGKSVLARSILRLNPSAIVAGGSIRFDGRDVYALSPRELRALRGAGIGMVFQDPATYLNPVFTVGSQMADTLRAHGLRGGAAIRARSVELLEAVRLPEADKLLARYPHELSGGMRQRVLIAQALAAKPRMLIADEPTTALDATVQLQVLRLISGLVARLGLTLMLISHDLGVIGATCRRVVVMYAGNIVEDAPAASLFATPRHPYTRGLLASVPDLARPDALPSGIPGRIPSLREPPQGCRFHPRCPLAMPVCRETRPALTGDAHRVACYAA
ncbi:MAG: ABC transporter ATP-binding protein [Acidisphaera sp.]|nr:ABC transporter ATP-binding protein [Acidisphaera sp.]MBV9813610.1 ABC transporter ATP-binding protein [Acetobacteraceae bacterium]